MKAKITHGAWSCFCGYLDRLKFRNIQCPCCRTACLVKEPTVKERFNEMANQLKVNYAEFPHQAARLVCHHFWVMSQVK
jgi:hypothetical protein